MLYNITPLGNANGVNISIKLASYLSHVEDQRTSIRPSVRANIAKANILLSLQSRSKTQKPRPLDPANWEQECVQAHRRDRGEGVNSHDGDSDSYPAERNQSVVRTRLFPRQIFGC